MFDISLYFIFLLGLSSYYIGKNRAKKNINLIILILIFIVIDLFLILISLLWLRLNIRKNYKLLLWVIILNIVFIILLFFPDELQNYIEKKKKKS